MLFHQQGLYPCSPIRLMASKVSFSRWAPCSRRSFKRSHRQRHSTRPWHWQMIERSIKAWTKSKALSLQLPLHETPSSRPIWGYSNQLAEVTHAVRSGKESHPFDGGSTGGRNVPPSPQCQCLCGFRATVGSPSPAPHSPAGHALHHSPVRNQRRPSTKAPQAPQPKQDRIVDIRSFFCGMASSGRSVIHIKKHCTNIQYHADLPGRRTVCGSAAVA